ncbi:MAG: hypothetical protein RL557_280 [archaeon]|jgi:hypothetical protein
MEKDIGKIKKNDITDIVVRIDDFGGRIGLTIREFTHSDRYTGFTKSGTRISAESFKEFKELINSVDEKMFENAGGEASATPTKSSEKKPADKNQKTLAPEEEIKEEFY